MEGTTADERLPWRARIGALRGSETANAGVLAAATMAQQLIAVIFTVIFTRLLGTDGYGSLAALLNLTVILMVAGSSLQVAAAREGTLGRLGRGGELAGTLERWERHLVTGMVALAAVSILARGPLSELVNVEEEWAAAAVPVAGALWLLVCVQRGLLQASKAYVPVAASIVLEGLGRVAVALVLVGVGAGVTGAYLGTAAAFACAALALHVILRRRLGPPDHGAATHPLRSLARNAAIPIAALVLVAALQNVDVIMAKHALNEDDAGVYAATTVAAKLVVWIAVGIGLWVVPEATSAAAAGRDPRRVLVRALGLIALVAIPALAMFAAVPGLLLEIAFGPDYERGDEVLLTLGAAYALLAATYLCVQFLLGLHHRGFALILLVAAVAEPVLLLGADSLSTFAGTVLAVQAAAAVLTLLLAVSVKTSRAGVSSSADAV
jgi:O-antigen/teichoic acid export membrane protein